MRRCRSCAVIGHDLRWDQPNDDKNAEWDDDEVVEITQNRDEIRNEVDRGQRIARDRHGQKLGVPRNTGIVAREVERVDIARDD